MGLASCQRIPAEGTDRLAEDQHWCSYDCPLPEVGESASTLPSAHGAAPEREREPQPDPEEGSETGGDGGNVFLGDDEIAPLDPPCDQWAQDCPAGEKCIPVASTPGSGAWDYTLCVPVVDGPRAVGEPCRVAPDFVAHEGGIFDDCDATSMCFDLMFDEATGQVLGTCVEQCVGPENAPQCPQTGASCFQNKSGLLSLCIQDCDPVWQNCPAGCGCYFGSPDATTRCEPAGTGTQGSVCAEGRDCATGFDCAPARAVAGCAGERCCTRTCALDSGAGSFGCDDLPGTVCSLEMAQEVGGESPPDFAPAGLCSLAVSLP